MAVCEQHSFFLKAYRRTNVPRQWYCRRKNTAIGKPEKLFFTRETPFPFVQILSDRQKAEYPDQHSLHHRASG